MTGLSAVASAEPSAGFPLPPEETAAPPPPPAAPRAPPRAPAPLPPRAAAPAPAPTPPPPPGRSPEPAAVALPDAEQRALPPPAGFPLVLPYREGVPIPRGYHVEHRAATGLIVVGSVTLSLSYVLALGLGVHNSFEGGYGWTVLPVAGPWGAIGARDFKCKVNSTDFDVNDPSSIDTGVTAAEAERCIKRAQTEAIDIAILAMDGMVQATGAALLIAGLASGVDELVWDGLEDVHVSLGPRPEGGGQIGVFGRF